MKQRYFYMLIGVPGSGKSTWTQNYIDRNYKDNDIVVISTDNIIEKIAKSGKMTYNDVFDDITYSFAEKVSHKVAKFNFKQNTEVVIWDQTNLTISSRKKKLSLVPEHYYKIAVYFPIPKDHLKRLSSRTGKTIPEKVLESMIRNQQIPNLNEGFDKVIVAENE